MIEKLGCKSKASKINDSPIPSFYRFLSLGKATFNQDRDDEKFYYEYYSQFQYVKIDLSWYAGSTKINVDYNSISNLVALQNIINQGQMLQP